MSMQTLNQIAHVERTAEHAWGMAIYSFMTATDAICTLTKSQPYRDMAVDDLNKITEATLAINLMWSQLKARRAA